jgi:transcriptional regulator with GAF, ATPase, and Fis domain
LKPQPDASSDPLLKPVIFPEFVGTSPALRRVLHAVVLAARADYPVLIEGESGTGKELAALAIHRLSIRSDRPFLGENCGALPANLVESECFGHEKGAFTGAIRTQAGIFERARGGTVFLDEVGEMDLSMQRKLLRVLQDKQVRRVGGQEVIRVDFRILSATNRNMENLVYAGAFRHDLFFRLNVATIRMPPLRERSEDIPLLIQHFIQVACGEGVGRPLEFSKNALKAVNGYYWPGNIRELRNEILRLVSIGRQRVRVRDLSCRIRRALECDTPPTPRESGTTRRLSDVERDVVGGAILAAIRNANGNRAEAARRLGITRSSLYRRLHRYRLDPARLDTFSRESPSCRPYDRGAPSSSGRKESRESPGE